MLTQENIFEIRRLARKGYSQRKISKKLRFSRNSVQKYLSQEKEQTQKTKRIFSKLKPFANIIANRLLHCPGIPAVMLYREIKTHGYKGSVTTVQDYILKNLGKILAENKKVMSIKIAKADLYQCMVKGNSYLKYIRKKSNLNSSSKKNSLTDEERISIIRKGKAGKFKQWRFGVIIDMVAEGISAYTISKTMHIDRGTIKSYLQKYEKYGIEEVKQKRKSVKVSERSRIKHQRIFEMIHHPPKYFNLNRSKWTRVALSKTYETLYGESIDESTVGCILKKAGYSLKKAKRVLTSSDPDYREKIELLLITLQTLQPSETLFFIDEVGPMRVKKYGGRIYIKNGDRNYVSTNQTPKGSVIFSASLDATTNQLSWIYGMTKDTNSMVDLIEILFNQHFHKTKFYITWDAASWHSSKVLVDWLNRFNEETRKRCEGPLIEFIPLPSCSQFLNIIESTFSSMKKAVIHNSNYQSNFEMMTAISGYFKERNDYFLENPKRAGKKIWEIDFFQDNANIKSGDYREW